MFRNGCLESIEALMAEGEIYDIEYDLKSAQPEIIRCKDCEWWEKQKDSLQGRCELMQKYPTGAWYCGNAQRRKNDEQFNKSAGSN